MPKTLRIKGSTDHRDSIINELQLLRDGSIANKDRWRIQAYTKALEAIEELPGRINSVSDLEGVRNIGKGILEKIGQVIKSGSSKKGDEFRKDPHLELIIDLTKISGVGPVLANKLVKEKGVVSIQDLTTRKTELLTQRQQLGLDNYTSTIKRIPREEMMKHHDLLTQILGYNVTIAGSFRRQAESSGDIDVLLRDDEGKGCVILGQFISLLKELGYLVGDINVGSNKYNGYCRLPTGRLDVSRRIDIMYTNVEEFPFSLLYFTGSGPFNQEMRAHLSSKDFRLNEHNLKRQDGEGWDIVDPSKFRNEKDIFRYIGVRYVLPENRTRENFKKALRTTITKVKTLKIKPTPQHQIPVGGTFNVGKWTITRNKFDYMCNCPGWLYQSLPPNQRTCKHIRQVLGDQYEDSRVGGSKTVIKKVSFVAPKSKENSFQPLLANSWNPETDPTGYWVSEKLDGVRAIWDGKTMKSRQGKEFPCPKWFKETLPRSNIILDGELFTSRKNFQETVSIVKNSGLGEEWKKLTFRVFDIPSESGGFEERVAKLKTLISPDSTTMRVVEQTKVINKQDVLDKLKIVIRLGGEGLMLREPKSKYINARSNTLLKVKTFYDAEAVVIGYTAGRGKNVGYMGALECRMECGNKFRIGTGFTDAVRRAPPSIGSIVTYRFQELTKSGVPRFGSYVGIRIDQDFPKDYIFK
jgi:DNA polymerase/3'-5' exonuclease PolX